MAFYKIIANNSIESTSSESNVKNNDRLIGHINSEQIGNKYVYVIHFDNNIDSNQQLNDCSLHSTDKTSVKDSIHDSNQFNLNIETIEQLAQIINISKKSAFDHNNTCDQFNTRDDTNQDINETKFDHKLTTSLHSKQDYQQKDDNNCNNNNNNNNINGRKLYKYTKIDRNGAKCKSLMGNMCSVQRPFICQWPECDKRFNRKGILITHMRTHTGERPFRCDWDNCGKRFNQICVLKNHKRTHTGERPYVCDWADCGHSFKTSGSLHHHRMNHTVNHNGRHDRHDSAGHNTISANKKLNTTNTITTNAITTNTTMSAQFINDEKISKTTEMSRSSPIKNIIHNNSNNANIDEKCTQSPKTPEIKGKNSYECTFENCNQKFARKCALINHFNYRHQSDCY